MSGPPAPRPTLGSFWHDLPREGRLLLSVVAVQFVGTGLVLPFWVVYLHELRGFSLSTTGLLLGAQALAGLAVLGPAGGLIDRVGARAVLIGTLSFSVLGQALAAFASSVPLAAVALVLSGIANGVSFPASQTLVATVVPSGIRQRYFGVNFTLLNLGIGVGGLVGGVLVDLDRPWTLQALFLGDAVAYLPGLFLLLVPLRHVSGRAPRDPGAGTHEARASYLEVLRLPALPMLLLLSFVVSFVAYAQLNSGMPAYARAVGQVSTRGLGIAFAANTLVIVLLQLVVLQRIEGHRRTRVIAVMAAIWAVAWVLLGGSGLVAGTVGATLLVAACASVFALGETLLQPTVPAILNDLTTDRLRGRANAAGSIAFQVPQVVAPPVAGFLVGHGLESAYVGGLLVGCALVAVISLGLLEPRLDARANGVGSASTPPGPPAAAPLAETPPAVPTPTLTPGSEPGSTPEGRGARGR